MSTERIHDIIKRPYIEEMGTDVDGWEYIKYSNGRYEACRLIYDQGTTTPLPNSSGLYYISLSTTSGLAYPSWSKGVSSISYLLYQIPGNVSAGWLGTLQVNGLRVLIVNGAITSTSGFRYYANLVGRWK